MVLDAGAPLDVLLLGEEALEVVGGRCRPGQGRGGGRRRAEQGEPGSASVDLAEAAEAGDDTTDAVTPSAPLTGAPTTGEPDDLERLLAEEEEIERRTRNEHHETPHFRKESD